MIDNELLDFLGFPPEGGGDLRSLWIATTTGIIIYVDAKKSWTIKDILALIAKKVQNKIDETEQMIEAGRDW